MGNSSSSSASFSSSSSSRRTRGHPYQSDEKRSPNVWSCPRCTYDNPIHNLRCAMCRKHKPTPNLFDRFFSDGSSSRSPPRSRTTTTTRSTTSTSFSFSNNFGYPSSFTQDINIDGAPIPPQFTHTTFTSSAPSAPPDFRNEPDPKSGPPPADESTIRSLFQVIINQTHVENKETCSICLEEFPLDSPALQLPCFHLFHKVCVYDWLKKHCCCPNCRAEIKSIDPSYDQKKAKEKKQEQAVKLKDKITTSMMKETLTQKNIDHENIVDKEELILIYLEALTIKELKKILLERKIECSDCVEKYELSQRVKMQCF